MFTLKNDIEIPNESGKVVLEKTKNTFVKEMQTRGCLGQISELYDSKQPNLPKGTFAQGWSVAEVFRIIYEREI